MSEETQNVAVQINIPTSIYLHGRRPLQETKEVAIEHLQIQAGILFDFISYGSSLVENDDFDQQQFLSLCGVIGKIGSGLTEAMESVRNDFDGIMKNASLPEVENG